MPDLQERRGGFVLMIWGDAGHWLVADEELAGGVCRVESADGLEAAFGRKLGRDERKQVLAALEGLRAAGVMGPSRGVAEEEPRIHNIAINLTRRCNLRCRFCYVGHGDAGHVEVSADQIAAFLLQAKPLCAADPVITILGGEPLLEPEKLLDVVSAGRRLGFNALVSTNGMRVTEAFAREAARLGLEVQVSLDGYDSATHDWVRGKDTFETAVAGARVLIRNRVHTILSMVAWREGLIRPFFQLARDLKANEARFIPLKTIGAAADGRPIALGSVLREGLAVYRDEPGLRSLFGRDALSILADTCQFPSRRGSCGSGSQTVLLDADGSLYPCLNTCASKFCFGNIGEAEFSFQKTWKQDANLARYRSAIRVEQPEHGCRACPVRRWCLGGCRGETDASTGDLQTRSPHCEDLRRAILDVMWMLAETPEIAKKHRAVC